MPTGKKMSLEVIGPPDPRNEAYRGLLDECQKMMGHLYTLVPGYEITLVLRNTGPTEGAHAILSNGTNLIPAMNLLVEYHNRMNTPPTLAPADNRSH